MVVRKKREMKMKNKEEEKRSSGKKEMKIKNFYVFYFLLYRTNFFNFLIEFLRNILLLFGWNWMEITGCQKLICRGPSMLFFLLRTRSVKNEIVEDQKCI